MEVYRPWSDANLALMLRKYAGGMFSVLDLEMTAQCSLTLRHGGCIYCDSKVGRAPEGECTMDEIRDLLRQAHSLQFDWLYVCGLGEPSDDPKLFETLRLARELGMSASMFTNGINYTPDDVRFLRDCEVNLIVKCDSLKPDVFNRILGNATGSSAQSIYRTIDACVDSGYSTPGRPSLAVSIVPTTVNLGDIPDVVRFCAKRNVFPLIGQLECAGKALRVYKRICPSDDDLASLKREVEEILGHPYSIPVCPAGVGSLHISNVGDCVSHRATGLSCPWFSLEEPILTTLGNIREVPLAELANRLLRYRRTLKIDWASWTQKCAGQVFGGCGGNALLQTYRRANS